jgi:predicted RNA binding protein YcfA (HicA-like mRNA interferase family)
MKLPRDLSGTDLVRRLERLGYSVTRQTGSHLRLTCPTPELHHITIPAHNPLRIGPLAAILGEIDKQQGLSREDLLRRLFE